jgi:4-coumarate--CoA ligase
VFLSLEFRLTMSVGSAAGKILRRELRERAKTELAGRDPGDEEFKAKL